jgi:hypothetical protein
MKAALTYLVLAFVLGFLAGVHEETGAGTWTFGVFLIMLGSLMWVAYMHLSRSKS